VNLSAKVSIVIAVMTDRPSNIVAASLIVASAAGVGEFSLLTFLAHLNVSRLSLRIQNSTLTGIVSGACVWALLVMISLRRQFLRKKLHVVADLNHELRNALEVILQSEYLPVDQRLEPLHDSAERLNTVLTQLLEELHTILPVPPDRKNR
jgi:signal transduction histidine kinase